MQNYIVLWIRSTKRAEGCEAKLMSEAKRYVENGVVLRLVMDTAVHAHAAHDERCGVATQSSHLPLSWHRQRAASTRLAVSMEGVEQ